MAAALVSLLRALPGDPARVLERAAATAPGVVHVEADIADRPDLAERFAVTSTPTVVLLDPAGNPVTRVVGVPSLAQARASVTALTTAAH